MAMCLAPLALLFDIKIKNVEVVNKSYPSYWEDLKKDGIYNISSNSLKQLIS